MFLTFYFPPPLGSLPRNDIYHSQYVILSPDSSGFNLSAGNTRGCFSENARHRQGAHYYHAQRDEEPGCEEEDVVRDVLRLPPVGGAALPTDLGAEPAPANQGGEGEEEAVGPAEEDHEGNNGARVGRLGISLKQQDISVLVRHQSSSHLVVHHYQAEHGDTHEGRHGVHPCN